jgi:hypothetical protein
MFDNRRTLAWIHSCLTFRGTDTNGIFSLRLKFRFRRHRVADSEWVLSGDLFGWNTVPSHFSELLHCSPIKGTHRHYWWRAQASTYLFRFNKRTRREIDDFKRKHLVKHRSGAKLGADEPASSGTGTGASVPSGTFGAFIRLSKEKQMEIQGGKGARHFHAMATIMVALQAGEPTHVINNHIAECTNRSAAFRTGELRRAVLISADSNTALDEAMTEHDPGGALDGWDYFFTKVSG